MTRPPGRGAGPARPAVQGAVAKIILDGELFAALRAGEFDQLAARLALAPDVISALRGISVSGLAHYRHTVQAKHLQHARAVLPVSVGVAVAFLGAEAVREDLWARAPLPYRPAARFWQSYLDLTARYLSGLAAESRPPWLPDLVRYEAMRAVGGGVGPAAGPGPAAGMPARTLARTPAGAGRSRPRVGDGDLVTLADGVRVAAFGWDVIALYAGLRAGTDVRELAPQPAAVLLAVCSSGWPAVREFRLAPGMFGVLNRCARPVRVTELVKEAAGRDPVPETVAGRVRTAVAGALDCGLLTREASVT
jgi:hypothetical protein